LKGSSKLKLLFTQKLTGTDIGKCMLLFNSEHFTFPSPVQVLAP